MACDHSLNSLNSVSVGNDNLQDILERLIWEHLKKPSHVLPHLGPLVKLEVHNIILTEEERDYRVATKTLLEALKESGDHNWMLVLMEALRRQKYERLVWVMELSLEVAEERLQNEVRKMKDDDDKFEEFLLTRLDTFLNVNFQQVLAKLISGSEAILSEEDFEVLDTISRNHGPIKAMHKLVCLLPSKSRNWLVRLVRALQETKHVVALQDIGVETADTSLVILETILEYDPGETATRTKPKHSKRTNAADPGKRGDHHKERRQQRHQQQQHQQQQMNSKDDEEPECDDGGSFPIDLKSTSD